MEVNQPFGQNVSYRQYRLYITEHLDVLSCSHENMHTLVVPYHSSEAVMDEEAPDKTEFRTNELSKIK